MPTLIERVFARGRLIVERARYERFTRPLTETEIRSRFQTSDETAGFGRLDFYRHLVARRRCERPFRVLGDDALDVYRKKSEALARGGVVISGRKHTLGADVDWHRDPQFGVVWPKQYVGSLSDRREGTDVNLVWHLNKMQFLMESSAAYRATDNDELCKLGYSWITSWCEQNPFMIGMNWRSPMEMGIRLLAWSVWLQEVPLPETITVEKLESIFEAMVRQAEYLAAHMSEYRLPNNHLINESAMLYAFSTMWRELRDADRWKSESEAILVREIDHQVLADGFDFENAMNYHLFVLDSCLVFLLARVAENKEPPSAILDGVQTLSSTALSMISPTGRWPRMGDDSMSEFFVLADLRALEGTRFQGSVRFTDLLKPGMGETLRAVAWASPLLDLESTISSAWRGAQSGVTVFRTSHAQLTYCAGPEHDLEFNSGHIHSDAGSFELEITGQPVIIDSGTYIYGYDTEIRSHFRGAVAHNSLVIDGVDPMTTVETFRWLNVPRSKTVFWCEDPIPVVASVRECTDADANPFSHRRTVVWVAEAMWIIVDVVTPVSGSPDGDRSIDVHFHLPVDAGEVSAVDSSRATIALGPGSILTLTGWSDSPYQQELLSDRADRRTWYSEHFGDLKYGTTVVGTVRSRGACVLVHAIYDGSRGSVTPVFESGGVRLECRFDDERVELEVESGESIRILKDGTALANDLDRHAR
ncbi:MAG: alginate lyase family protein [bacterium]|nr:alginate lyase family protein [bacterium]